jgi:SAM-dependent methyltransferase
MRITRNVATRKVLAGLRLVKARVEDRIPFIRRASPATGSTPEGAKSQDIWAQRHLDPNYWNSLIHWGQVPQVAAYINRRISGDPKIDVFEYAAQQYLAPLRKKGPISMLSLCTGVGQIEISLVQRGYVDKIVGYEYSEECVAAANQTARNEGLADKISFIQADLNKSTFPPEQRFDAILNEAGLHHIKNLEHLISQCRQVCKPHTVFINHEFIGANHHQWSAKQMHYINHILSILPPELRRSLSNPGAIHEKKAALSMAKMLLIDPTEGVRAEEIIPVMKQHFAISDYKPFGGSILHMLLNDMAGNFIAPEHAPLVELLIFFEESLMDEGVLPPDFAFWVGRPQ